MRTVLLAAVFIASTSVGAVTLSPTAAVAPCTTATEACVAWILHGKGPARTMVYSNYKLTERNDNIRRALIMVHGTNRNADHYFSTAVAAAFLAGALEDTIVVAPHLIINTDPKQTDEVVWPGGGDSWRSGGMSPSHPELSSFDVADELL